MGAYYSRNNSYSRSFNATQAESEGRFPLTRAAKSLGLSVAAFKAGCEKAHYTASEWHHVGKYANRVDYYDTKELNGNYKFWKGAATKKNKNWVEKEVKRCLKAAAKEAIEEMMHYNLNLPNKGYRDCGDNVVIFNDCKNPERAILHAIRTIGPKRLKQARYNEAFVNAIRFRNDIKSHKKITLNLDGSVWSRDYDMAIDHLNIDWENFFFNGASSNDTRFLFNRKNN